MGIPAYFRNIVEQNKTVLSGLQSCQPQKVDILYLDFNAIIYNVYAELLKETNSAHNIESKIINAVIEEIRKLLTLIIPSKMLYIGFDGPAPLAKMHQQRSRRYKSLLITDEDAKILFDTKKISPGTEFMANLSKKLKTVTFSQDFTTVISDASEAGEGEHKILKLVNALEDTNDIIIYSPDADMIVLSLVAIWKNPELKIRILRRTSDIKQTTIVTDFMLLNIDIFKRHFIDWLKKSIRQHVKQYRNFNRISESNLVLDYIFLTMLAGNDFVIPVQYLSMRIDNMQLILKHYSKVFVTMSNYLIVDGNVNLEFLTALIKSISEDELVKFQQIQKKINRLRKFVHDGEPGSYQHELFFKQAHPDYAKYNKVFDSIDYFKSNWRDQYYTYYGIPPSQLDVACKEYVRSLYFTFNYYVTSLPSWNWYYKFRCAPLFCDLADFLAASSKFESPFEEGQPLQPMTQLAIIMPPISLNLLPAEVQSRLMKSTLLKSYYIHGTDFELDVLAGQKFIYSEPILPEISNDIIQEIIHLTI